MSYARATGRPEIPDTVPRRPPGPDNAAVPGRSARSAGRAREVLIALGCYFFLANLMQSTVSLRGVALHVRGAALGILLALCSGGLGIVTDLGFAAYADGRGRHKVVSFAFAVALGSALLLFDERSTTLLWLAALGFGVTASATATPLLALLSGRVGQWRQTRLQGINGSVQRFGALIAAGFVGLSLALHSPAGLAGGLAGGAALGLVITWADGKAVPASGGAPARLGALLRNGYVRGLRMLRNRRIVIASVINIAINAIFLETNSFVPLLHDRGASALVVSGSLAARDVLAVVAGLAIAHGSHDVSSAVIVVLALALSALAAVGMGLCVHFSVLVAVVPLCAVQGVTVGVGIAATNLHTISATVDEERAVGMAASTVGLRAALIIVPLLAGTVLSAYGLAWVFYLFGTVSAALGIAVAVLMTSSQAVTLATAAGHAGAAGIDG
ncbi:MAG TPA: MFS transporter [Acidimicrobiales bacterium]|nr:MFS transporter [Acidimicrobiales bacterium]